MSQPGSPNEPVASGDLDAAWSHVWTSSDASTRGWLQGMRPVTVHDSLVILAVPNEFTRDRVESRLRPVIEQQLSDFYSRPIRLAIDVDPSIGDEEPPPLAEPEPEPEPPASTRST
ncbi:MAG: chromosomal replication initiation protein, partial [Propionibacteriaceae bacterium]|nr:chromosomal replication initiation protein [Propionibacteriaceae bacterium]